jgi:hypothetical protein
MVYIYRHQICPLREISIDTTSSYLPNPHEEIDWYNMERRKCPATKLMAYLFIFSLTLNVGDIWILFV